MHIDLDIMVNQFGNRYGQLFREIVVAIMKLVPVDWANVQNIVGMMNGCVY
jgi:hypothetical protein